MPANLFRWIGSIEGGAPIAIYEFKIAITEYDRFRWSPRHEPAMSAGFATDPERAALGAFDQP